jgi:putative spermidine/putrescine transport system permease protein
MFLLVSFVVPIAVMLAQSTANSEVREGLPRTIQAIAGWNGQELPSESVYAALVSDLRQAYEGKTITHAAIRLNYEIPGFRSLILSTARRLPALEGGSNKDALIRLDKRWGEREFWAAIRRGASPYTLYYYLAALDLRRNADNRIVAVAPGQAVYVTVFLRTLWIGLLVTVICLVVGYPVAYLLAGLPTRISNLLMMFVLLPFWTSLLVRTTAWIVLLQRQGLVNNTLVWLGLISERLALIFNRTGLLIAMTHILLPFMILPLYSVMRGIDPRYKQAAISLGAHPIRAFWTVYVPQTIPGIGSGSVLVFILSIGYYITPELVGGGGDQMVSHFIAIYTNETLNWGQASALGAILLTIVLLLYVVYSRVLGIEKMRLG